jgi:hypothetical protein
MPILVIFASWISSAAAARRIAYSLISLIHSGTLVSMAPADLPPYFYAARTFPQQPSAPISRVPVRRARKRHVCAALHNGV